MNYSESMRNISNIFMVAFYLLFSILFSQNIFASMQDVSAVKAMRLFDSGNYPESEKMFKHLLRDEPLNPMLNYYWGASRTENGHFTDRELNSLLLAGKHAVIDRLQYYLGIQYQARNNWEQALKYYNQFRQSVPETEQKNLKLSEKIQQCYNQYNPFSEIIIQQEQANMDKKNNIEAETETEVETEAETEKNTSIAEPKFDDTEEIIPHHEIIDKTTSEEIVSKEEFEHISNVLPDLPDVKITLELPKGKQIDFQINNQITYLLDSQFKTSEGKAFFLEGKALQTQLDKILNETNALRNNYRNTSNPELKAELGEKIIKLENDSYSLQDEANQKFSIARNHENQYWNEAGEIAVHNFKEEQQKISSSFNSSQIEVEKQISEENDTISDLILDKTLFFEPQPASRPTDKLVYKIQIGAYSKGVPAFRQRLYNKLSLLRKIENYTDEKGVVIYTTGNLSNIEDAEKMRSQIKQEGIVDAQVVPYFNGKRITLEQAKNIEAGNDIKRD